MSEASILVRARPIAVALYGQLSVDALDAEASGGLDAWDLLRPDSCLVTQLRPSADDQRGRAMWSCVPAKTKDQWQKN